MLHKGEIIRFTLVQRLVYQDWLNHGFRPVDAEGIAERTRLQPSTVLQILNRCVQRGWARRAGPGRTQATRPYALTEEGVVMFNELLSRPRYPEQ